MQRVLWCGDANALASVGRQLSAEGWQLQRNIVKKAAAFKSCPTVVPMPAGIVADPNKVRNFWSKLFAGNPDPSPMVRQAAEYVAERLDASDWRWGEDPPNSSRAPEDPSLGSSSAEEWRLICKPF